MSNQLTQSFRPLYKGPTSVLSHPGLAKLRHLEIGRNKEKGRGYPCEPCSESDHGSHWSAPYRIPAAFTAEDFNYPYGCYKPPQLSSLKTLS